MTNLQKENSTQPHVAGDWTNTPSYQKHATGDPAELQSTTQSSIAIEKEKTNSAEPGKNVSKMGKTLGGNRLGVQ